MAVIALREPKSSSDKRITRADPVHHLFVRIAEILLKLGVDAPDAERTLRGAFVDAAMKRSRESGLRLTQSQIASMAGISRLEVRNLMKPVAPKGRESTSRLEQVLSGWRADAKYLDRQGRPKKLCVRGREGSFETLAKRYGRDVTPKALRVELVRRGLATVRGETIQLAKRSRSDYQQLINASNDLRSLISYLAAYDLTKRRRSYSIRREVINATSAKNASVIRQLATDRLQTVLNSIAELSMKRPIGRRKPSSLSHQVQITTVVASEGKD